MGLSIPYQKRYAFDDEGKSMTYRRDLWEVAAQQHGVFTLDDADAADVPAVEVRKMAARGALRRYGQGVYVHLGTPQTRLTEPAVAVALGGKDAFLERESVFDLLGIGQFNPRKIRVGTTHRVRRTLPEWIGLENRADIRAEDVTAYEGIPSTHIRKAFEDMLPRMPRERWEALLGEAIDHELVEATEAARLRGLAA